MRTAIDISDKKVMAYDISKDNCEALKKNIPSKNLADLGKEDFFKREEGYSDKGFIIASNLPYGKRIKTKENIHDFVEKFLDHGFKLGAKSIYIVMPETFKINSSKFKLRRSERIRARKCTNYRS